MPPVQRPLSPHLQVYKLPLTAIMSIMHRITGASLALGTLLIAAFFIAAASGEAHYNVIMGLASSTMGTIILFLWSAALYFHMCNGIRHMFFDMGKLLDKKTAKRSNYYVLAGAIILTTITWVANCSYFAG